VRSRSERLEQSFACHASAILFSREERETAVFGLHDEFCRFLGSIPVVVAEGVTLRHGDASFNGGYEKLFRITDPCKGQHFLSLQGGRPGWIGRKMAAENTKGTGTSLLDDILGTCAFTNHQQRVALRDLRGQWCPQGAGRKYAPVADATPRIDHGQREVLPQRGILQSVIHDDEACTVCAGKLCPAGAISCDDCRCCTGEQQRLVADPSRDIGAGIHQLRPRDISAIAAAKTKRPLAGIRSIRASIITVGVLPAPPSVKFPTHRTGTPTETPFIVMRLAAMAP
jgi:hypothetical protein